MADQNSAVHPHRLKMDGSTDSICLNCLATVTSTHGADQSERTSVDHVCHPVFSAKRRADVKH